MRVRVRLHAICVSQEVAAAAVVVVVVVDVCLPASRKIQANVRNLWRGI